MACFTCDIVGCIKCVYEESRFITCAYWNKKKLVKEMKDLKDMRENVTKIIDNQEQPRTRRKVAVWKWLDRVNGIDKQVTDLVNSLRQRSGCTCCFAACHGRKLLDLIDDVHALVEEGRRYLDGEMVLVQPIPINPIDNVPDLSTPMVGRNLRLSEITDYLKGDSQVQTIGIWGTRGIGKTTLLKSIKYELSKNYDFFQIVWIEIQSQNVVDIVDIQKQIASCISLSFQLEEDESERARILNTALVHKKTLILIDNVWNKLDFEKIGIPFGVNIDNVKIVFTTRFEGVCTDMTAQKIVKLDYLDAANSLQLFQNNINFFRIEDYQIRERINKILEKCGGLPLVILTVARTVAGYTRVEEWDDAVYCLTNLHEEIEGMDEVMKCLKFSYDKLGSDDIRSCLLYFSLYPEGDSIRIEELIKEWIGEGFLDVSNNNSFKNSYDRGYVFINKLKSLCLVESGFSYETVKVHDVIRDMLRLISKDEKREVVLVYHKDQDDVSNYNDWDLAKRIYLNECQLKILPHENGMPSCPNLTTLLVEANYSHRIFKLPTEDFFHWTPSLRVLDLSYTGLVVMPRSIGELGELRYLNLFRTRVLMLPKELGNLKKLMCLDLGETSCLKSIAKVSISQMSMLQSLDLLKTNYQWNSDSNMHELMFEDLSELKNLEDLGVDVSSNSQLNTIFGNQIISNSITSIRFVKIDFTEEDLQPIKLISERFPRLKLLIVDGCVLPGNVLEIKDDHPLVVENLSLWNLKISSVMIVKDGCRRFGNLKILEIFKCECLKEVSWTTHLTSLQELLIRECHGIEELVATRDEEIEEERDCYFPKLRSLMILDLQNLQRIHERSRPLLFPALERLFIGECPELKQLSLGLDSANKIQIIRCEQEKWDSLEWEDDQVKDKFLRYFCASSIF